MTDSEKLPHEFATPEHLERERLYYALQAARTRPADTPIDWEQLAFFLNTKCPHLPRRSAAEFEAAFATLPRPFTTGKFASQFEKYSFWIQLFPDSWWTFMNYGFEDFGYEREPLSLEGADAYWRLAVQLYHRTLHEVPVTGRHVLEVGSGRGGGASYVTRRFKPASFTACDGTRSNVRYCRARHQVERLEFVHGYAEDLPFREPQFDVVLNIESCGYYRPISAFLESVRRCLKSGGHFAVATYGPLKDMQQLFASIAAAGFEVCVLEDISTGVARAMTQFVNHDLWRLIADQETVRPKQLYLEELAWIWRVPELLDGTKPYYRAVYRRG